MGRTSQCQWGWTQDLSGKRTLLLLADTGGSVSKSNLVSPVEFYPFPFKSKPPFFRKLIAHLKVHNRNTHVRKISKISIRKSMCAFFLCPAALLLASRTAFSTHIFSAVGSIFLQTSASTLCWRAARARPVWGNRERSVSGREEGERAKQEWENCERIVTIIHNTQPTFVSEASRVKIPLTSFVVVVVDVE